MKPILALLGIATVAHGASTGGFALGAAGSITSDPTEVVDGARSIKGSYFGTTPFQNYLTTDPARAPLQRNQAYRISFRYKILSANQGFDVLFYSGTAAAQKGPLPSDSVTGAAGATGTFSVTGTLGPYDDYSALWTIHGTGSIAIDDVQIVNVGTGAVVAGEDAEPGTFLLSAFFVSASKQTFVFGEPVKVAAATYDENGNVLSAGPVAWTVSPTSAASVASDGTVTPRALTTFTVQAVAPGGKGSVVMQAVPLKIVVTPEKTSMLVGSTQKMRADPLDVNGQPIANAAVIAWSTSSNGIFDESPSATIDSTGTLRAVRQARVRIVASIPYSQGIPDLDLISQGDTTVDITAPVTYQFERIFTAQASGAATSSVSARASTLVPTESGGFMFAASLDGVGSALLEWNKGDLTPLLASGRVNLATGFPLADFVNYARTPSGQLLVQEADSLGSGLVSLGPPGLITPVFSNGAALIGAQTTNTFDISRNSLADSGAMLVRVFYTDAVTQKGTHGLFRGSGRGLNELVINDASLDNGYIDSWGIADDGTAWLHGGLNDPGLWRSRPGEQPKRVLSVGDPIGGQIFGGYLLSASAGTPLLFVAGNGDCIDGVHTDKGQNLFLLWHAGDSTPAATLSANVYGIHWYDSGAGALIDAGSPLKRGLYLWNTSGTRPVLLLNDTSIDGSPVQQILSAVVTSDGAIYAMLRTANNPLVIARLGPTPQILLQSGDSVPVNVPPVITALIPGGGSGIPMVIVGGQSGSIAQLDAGGTITPLVAVGSQLPDGKYFAGSRVTMVRPTAGGGIVFAHDYVATDSGLYTWNQGKIELTVAAPLTRSDGVKTGTPRNIRTNRQGDVAFQMTWGGNAVYRVRNGQVTAVVEGNPSVDGATVQNAASQGIDDSGNVLFSGTKPDGSGFYLAMWDGSAAHVILSPGYKMPDGSSVSGNFFNFSAACGDGFVASIAVNGAGVPARYRNGSWSYMADPSLPLATGAPANYVHIYDVSRPCGIVFLDGFATAGIAAFAGSGYHEIQDLQRLTPNGDLLSVSHLVINDDATIYALGANDRGEQVLYRATPIQ